MNKILHDLSEYALIQAIEANTREFLLTLGRLGGGEARIESTLQWTIGGAPVAYHNAVVYADLSENHVDEAILASVQSLRAHNVPGSWHVGPSMRPTDIGKRLLAHGFTYGGEEPGMAIDLQKLLGQIAVPAEFIVERVRTESELQIWMETLAQGFGEGEIEANWVGAMYRKIGFSKEGPWHHYLGRLQGKPVATTSLFLGAGVAGIYFVFTLEEARRQGIGAAMTVAALQEARQRGYHIGILTSSSSGYPIYQRLGFQHYCNIEMYELTAII